MSSHIGFTRVRLRTDSSVLGIVPSCIKSDLSARCSFCPPRGAHSSKERPRTLPLSQLPPAHADPRPTPTHSITAQLLSFLPSISCPCPITSRIAASILLRYLYVPFACPAVQTLLGPDLSHLIDTFELFLLLKPISIPPPPRASFSSQAPLSLNS